MVIQTPRFGPARHAPTAASGGSRNQGAPSQNPTLPPQNRLLAAARAVEPERSLPTLEAVHFDLGQVLCESGANQAYIYFPTSAVVSLLHVMQDGCVAEAGLVGNDGAVGVGLFLGGGQMPSRAVVQIAGDAIRIKATALQDEFRRGGALQRLLLIYTQALITQISQTAACNRLHPLEQRLCRCLLLCYDRVKSDEVFMTQDSIAHMLGGRRPSVTVAAGRLQQAGLVRYSRGHILILDRMGLESAACECYRVIRDEYDRLLA